MAGPCANLRLQEERQGNLVDPASSHMLLTKTSQAWPSLWMAIFTIFRIKNLSTATPCANLRFREETKGNLVDPASNHREALADRRADDEPRKKVRDEFDFDEGRFDDPDDDDDDGRPDEGGDSPSKSKEAVLKQIVQGDGDERVSDYWERHDEDNAWCRVHVDVRKKFFGATNEDLPPGGPTQEEIDTSRVTHMRGIDAVGNWVRDDRRPDAPNHRHFTRGFWTGVTILFDKGCVPRGRFRPNGEGVGSSKDKKKDHKLRGDRIDYDQSAVRRERPYKGS